MKLTERVRTRLRWKMALGFLLLSLVPCLAAAGIYSTVTYRYFAQERETFEQGVLSQYCTDVEEAFLLCESLYGQICQSSSFLEFLDGAQRTAANQLIAYQKEYSSMLNYAERYSPYVDSVRIYMLREDRLRMGRYLYGIEDLGEYELDRRTGYGYWRFEETSGGSGSFLFRRTLWDHNLTHPLGILEIKCTDAILTEKLESLSDALGLPVFAIYEERPYAVSEGSLMPAESGGFPLETAVRQDFSILPLTVCLDRTAASPARNSLNPVTGAAAAAIALILGFSVIYFIWVSRLSRRIVAFTRHISHSFTEAPAAYRDSGRDEFSQLVQSFNEMLENNSQLVNQIKLEQLRQSETEYKMLRAQIDPHFLFNALENIRMLAEEHDDRQTAGMIVSLSRLMRSSFSFHTGEGKLGDEIDLVTQYLRIQGLRYGRWLEHEISCPRELYAYGCPRFIIQPLVENAIKHGMETPRRTLFIKIQARMDGDRILVVVENNGKSLAADKLEEINRLLKVGRPLTQLSAGTGIGLDNINSRMRWLYPESFEMALQPRIQGRGLLVLLSWQAAVHEKEGDLS